MKIIVTGGCGFIGSHLVDDLINKNHDVFVIDNHSAKTHSIFYTNSKAFYSINSICDFNMCSDIFRSFSPDVVFNLAAEASITSCEDNPVLALNTNVLGTCNLLELSKKYQVKKFIQSSTSAVYGNKEHKCLEDSETDCLNMYSITKRMSEDLCKRYSKEINVSILRYFNVYGKRQPEHGNYASVISIFQKQKQSNKPLTIVGDGQQTRDFVHVSDVVDANIRCISDVTSGEIYNVGSGNSVSIKFIADLISKEQVFIPERQKEIRYSSTDIQKIKKCLGWEPKVKIEQWLCV